MALNKEQTWELLEIHNLLGNTSSEDDGYGFNLLTEFIEKYGFANALVTKPCITCKTAINSDVWEEELGMCVTCSNAYYSHAEEKEENV